MVTKKYYYFGGTVFVQLERSVKIEIREKGDDNG